LRDCIGARSARPWPTRSPERVSPALGPHEATVRGWLLADVDAPRKQRHTARRVWQRLIEEEGAQVAESSVRAMVAELKVEVGLDRQVSVPQTHPPGMEAEVDFGEFRAVIAGIVVKLWMFVRQRRWPRGGGVRPAWSIRGRAPQDLIGRDLFVPKQSM
jgi:hypothetical protein